MNKIKVFLKKIFHDKGIWLTLLLSLIVLIFFFGKILKHPNHVYFSKDGDGLQSYYTTIYHIKYDSTYSRFQGMNYPYGEHVLFTNCQPVISNTLKFISQNIVDVSDYAVGVINLMMLLSIVIAAVFLFLVFIEFEVNNYYGAFVAVGIAFLSPLIDRFGGHYSLSYVFTIPVVLFLLIKFYKNPSWKKSLTCGFFVLLMATFHIYNFAFAAFIIGIFWMIQLLSDKEYRKWKFSLLNIFLQIALPILVINIWLWLADNVNDRTSYPWGFLVYKSGWEGVFLQHQNVTIPFLKSFMHPQDVNWEGWAYAGHLASFFYVVIFTLWACVPFFTTGKMGFFFSVLVIGIVIHLFRRKKWNFFNLINNKLLSVFLWTGMITLLFSFAWPFTFFPDLLKYSGPVLQFRGIGRFTWIFFYVVNIGVFYFIYHLKINLKILKLIVLVLSILILYYDAYSNMKNIPGYLNNIIAELNDRRNISKENQWVSQINSEKYQSIIPLPFFHVGSENIGVETKCSSAYNTFLVSIKTGLPTNAVCMSRTSISQSCKNISLVLEPYKQLDLLNDVKSKKPFLLVVSKCDEFSDIEKNIISQAKQFYSSETMDFYELSLYSLQHISDSIVNAASEEIGKAKYSNGGFLTSDSVTNFIYLDFDSMKNNFTYTGQGSYSGRSSDFNIIYKGTLPAVDTNETYILSFWFGKITSDLYGRAKMEFAIYDSTGNCYFTDYKSVFSMFKIIDGKWALNEYLFKVHDKKDKIKITLWSEELTKSDTLYIDDLLVRPAGSDIFKSFGNGFVMKNDRFYKLE
ncbi:MAG: hypothetical protein V1904_10915 [Bacteroidota bacterium]